MVARVRCKNCRENIGHHWLYSTIMVCIESVVVILFGLYLIGSGYTLVVNVVLFVIALLLLTFFSSLFCPLEQKGSFIEP